VPEALVRICKEIIPDLITGVVRIDNLPEGAELRDVWWDSYMKQICLMFCHSSFPPSQIGKELPSWMPRLATTQQSALHPWALQVALNDIARIVAPHAKRGEEIRARPCGFCGHPEHGATGCRVVSPGHPLDVVQCGCQNQPSSLKRP